MEGFHSITILHLSKLCIWQDTDDLTHVPVLATHPVFLSVVEEVAPVRVSLHEPELKQFSHHQIQHSQCYLQGSMEGRLSQNVDKSLAAIIHVQASNLSFATNGAGVEGGGGGGRGGEEVRILARGGAE